MVILTQKQFNAELDKVYDHAYQVGLIAGKQEAILSKYTPNELREILGLTYLEDIKYTININPNLFKKEKTL